MTLSQPGEKGQARYSGSGTSMCKGPGAGKDPPRFLYFPSLLLQLPLNSLIPQDPADTFHFLLKLAEISPKEYTLCILGKNFWLQSTPSSQEHINLSLSNKFPPQ